MDTVTLHLVLAMFPFPLLVCGSCGSRSSFFFITTFNPAPHNDFEQAADASHSNQCSQTMRAASENKQLLAAAPVVYWHVTKRGF